MNHAMLSPPWRRKLRAAVWRLSFNIWPCLRRAGGRVTHIAEDFTRLDVRLDLNWKTRNIVGTIFGGSIYASTDPYYMLMLMQILGPDYVVWDKGCTIRFKRPARETIRARFEISTAMIDKILTDVAAQNEITFTWPLQYKNASGTVFAEFDKVLYVAKKDFYKEKLRARSIAAP
jgi:acyl-coenzyme A thioesterase PaaI-like protein